jgi:hypothetical protein
MLVSCICPTYGRAPYFLHLLQEAVECFYRQTWPAHDRELLILNDCHEQVLVCNTPGVRVINLGARMASLGEKYNLMVGMARGEIILPWEDDDISLPGRITQAVEMLGPSWDGWYWNPERTWFLSDRLYSDHTHGVCHNASAYRKTAWMKAGMYAALSGSQDADMDARLKQLGPRMGGLPDDPQQWQYIYCWNRSDVHLSGSGNPEQLYRDVEGKPKVAGTFEIKPLWQQNYVELCRSSRRFIPPPS